MKEYFCGWYFKCQSETQTLALIPAYHRSGKEGSSSLQLITDDGAWNVELPYESFGRQKRAFDISLGESRFCEKGIDLCLHTPELSAHGQLHFGALSPIEYDIMGPFRYVPFMECRHSVVSMRHKVEGELYVNGERYCFHDALGYIEGDRGYSFPKEYAWTQCFIDGGSVMLSVADIPFCGARFTGVVGIVMRQGREYRIATYLGAKAVRIGDGEIVVRQGNFTLSAKLIDKHAHPLMAPIGGIMNRTIHESAACRALYRFEKSSETLLEFESDRASFEYEYLK